MLKTQEPVSSSLQENNSELLALLRENNANLKRINAMQEEKIAYLEHRLELAELKNKEAISVKIENQRVKLQAKKALLSEKDEIILAQTGTINQLNEEINAMKSIHQSANHQQNQLPKGT